MSSDGRTTTEGAPAKAPGAAPAASPVTLTPLAADHVRALFAEQEVPEEERNLRVAVRAGGCSGFSYELGFDSVREGDRVAELEGIRVVVDPKSLPHLEGLTVDFVDTVQEQGFKIHNPNAKSSCGCGQSFQT